MHTSVNVSAKYLFLSLFSGTEALRLWWIFAALWWVAAAVVIASAGWNLGARNDA